MILEGARQVGKTWLMNEFAKNEYKNKIYITFYKNEPAKKLFKDTIDTKILLERISLFANKEIVAGETLLIFDEIQDCPNAVASLKYFNEDANEQHIISAGSLLGVYLAKNTPFPVGKVNLLNIYPMTFDEFLAVNDEGMYKYFLTVKSESDYISAFHTRMLEWYRKYLIIGGMPECVKSWAENQNPQEILDIQKELVTIYENDFSQHNKKIPAAKVLTVFRNIIPQLAKENTEKFVYSILREGARGKDYEEAIEWLVTSRIGLKVNNLSTPKYPLNAYNQDKIFKLFLLDVGLTKYMANIENQSILLDEAFSFKGQIGESFVVQQLIPQMDFMPNYYSLSRDMEIDFIIQSRNKIVPIEVKSSKNKRATSFKNYIEKYKPETAIRFSTNEYIINGNITNIPLYFASKTMELMS
ncbi:MAG: AAA family ATPase [Oscillospiraceae bacterium]|nr:AAA family ATPase [Oscillospiraceae bacterium]